MWGVPIWFCLGLTTIMFIIWFYVRLFRRLTLQFHIYRLTPLPITPDTPTPPSTPYLGYRFYTSTRWWYCHSSFYFLRSRRRLRFFSLYLLTRKVYFTKYIRSFLMEYLFLPHRDWRFSRSVRTFYTWGGKDLAYFFQFSMPLNLLRLGLFSSFFELKNALHRFYIWTFDGPCLSFWYNPLRASVWWLIYSPYTYFWVQTRMRLARKLTWYLRWAWWYTHSRLITPTFFTPYNWKFYFLHFFFSRKLPHHLVFCYLTLSIIYFQEHVRFTPTSHFSWINWINFQAHTWKFLS